MNKQSNTSEKTNSCTEVFNCELKVTASMKQEGSQNQMFKLNKLSLQQDFWRGGHEVHIPQIMY